MCIYADLYTYILNHQDGGQNLTIIHVKEISVLAITEAEIEYINNGAVVLDAT